MSLFQSVPLVLLAVVVILLPVLAIGISASKLDAQERTGVAVIYGAGIFLLLVIVADASGLLPDRLPVDLALSACGIFLGFYAMLVMGPRWSARWRAGK
jgi:hypothetical protein